MKVYLYTNVLVSAFTTRGLCADVLRHILADHELLTGEVNLKEFKQVLLDRLSVPQKVVEAIEVFILSHEVVPCPKKKLKIAIRDPDDAWVLASAVAANADVLLTGDRDLLDIADVSPIPILDARGFWELISQKDSQSREGL